MLLASLIILPPLKNRYSEKIPIRLRYILLISITVYWVSFFSFVGTLPGNDSSANSNTTYNTTGETERVLPKKTDFASSSPTQKILYRCVKVETIQINGIQLSDEDMQKICQGNYIFTLKDGENDFTIEVISSKGNFTENLKITFDEEAYKAQEQARRLAGAQAIVNKTINEFASEFSISSVLAKNLTTVFPEIGISKTKITSITKSTNWANGERYSMIYDGTQVFVYLNSDSSINSVNIGDVKLYQVGSESKNIADYILSSSDMSQLKTWAKDNVTSVLKAPSTASFPGSFLDPYADWGFGREGNIYKVSSYVDSQNSFGAMIRSNFYIEYKWEKDGDATINAFIFNGEKIK